MNKPSGLSTVVWSGRIHADHGNLFLLIVNTPKRNLRVVCRAIMEEFEGCLQGDHGGTMRSQEATTWDLLWEELLMLLGCSLASHFITAKLWVLVLLALLSSTNLKLHRETVNVSGSVLMVYSLKLALGRFLTSKLTNRQRPEILTFAYRKLTFQIWKGNGSFLEDN